MVQVRDIENKRDQILKFRSADYGQRIKHYLVRGRSQITSEIKVELTIIRAQVYERGNTINTHASG